MGGLGCCGVGDSEVDLVGVSFEFGGVHGADFGGEGAEGAGDFGPDAVADGVFAAGEPADEEGHAFVVEFDVGADFVAVVTAADFHGFKTGGLHIFEQDVLIVVLGIDGEFDFDEVAALDGCAVG